MSIKKVLIVAKKSAYQIYFNEYQEQPLRELARRGDQALLGIRRAHNAHYETLALVKAVLKKKNLPFDTCFRGEPFNPQKYGLVISVGGDGTFLEASRQLKKQMILGVNSDKNHSVGKLCVSDGPHFKKHLDKILRGKFKIKPLRRVKIIFNGKALNFFVLNDVLISHRSPAAMSHYLLNVGSLSERQRSSGVWIATAVGSTAAVHSAGGRRMPEGSASFQYLPRELFEGYGQHFRLRGGVIGRRKSFSVVSQMQEGMLYLDGAHRSMPFEYGDKIRISAGTPLRTVQF